MTTKYPSRLIVQPDWDIALRQRDRKIWCHFRKKDETKYMHLILDGSEDMGDEAKIVKIEQQQMTVDYLSALVTFQSPHTSYHGVHTKRKCIHSMDVAESGLGVSCDSQGKMLIWQTSDGEVRRTLEGHLAEVYVCRFFPSGIVVLSGGPDMQIKIWAAEDGRCAATMRGHRGAIYDLLPVERGRNIVSCCKDGSARLWDVGQSACLREFQSPDGRPLNSCLLHATDPSPSLPSSDPSIREVGTEGKLLLVASESGSVFAFDLRQGGGPVITWKTGDVDVNALALMPSPGDVAAGTAIGDLVHLDLRNPMEQIDRITNARSGIRSMHRASKFLFCGFGDGTVTRYDVTDPSMWVEKESMTDFELTGPDCEPITTIASSPDWLFTSCRDGVIRKYRRCF